MLKSKQELVAQEANINVVEIRQIEIRYFAEYFAAFGVQAEFIASFCAEVNEGGIESAPTAIQYVYWMAVTIGLICAMNAALNCAMIQIFGQGLALRGPIGSMAFAVDGMIVEQRYIVAYFSISIVMFTIAQICIRWGTEYYTSAIISTVIMIFAICYWYSHLLRIYNRFSYISDGSDGRIVFRKDTDERLKNLHRDFDPTHHKLNDEVVLEYSTAYRTNSSAATGSDQVTPADALKSLIFGTGYANKTTILTVNEGYVSPHLANPLLDKTVYHEGYILTTISMPNKSFASNSWNSLYLVAVDTLLFFYLDKSAFETAPKKPLRRRPIDLDGMSVEIKSEVSPFAIVIKPSDGDDERKPIELRCNTLTDMTIWLDILEKGIRKAALGFHHNYHEITASSS